MREERKAIKRKGKQERLERWLDSTIPWERFELF